MRFVVFGAGAVGGVVGGRLFQHGHDVVLIARGAHLEAISATGLLLQDPDGEIRLDIPAVGSAAEVDWRDDDICLLGVKSQGTDGALDALAAHASPDLRLACLQNGVDNERRALRRFSNVYGICVMLPSTYLEPGIVQANSAPITGALNIGRYPSGRDDVTEAVAGAFRTSTFLCEPSGEVMAQKYAKLLMNLGNAVEALTGSSDPSSDPSSDLVQRARREAMNVLRAAGVAVAARGHDAAQREHIQIREVAGERRGGGSTWQSLARGGSDVEGDYLNGEIVLLGRLHGVPTPINELLARAVAEAARSQQPPGSSTIDELEARLES